MRTHRDFLQPTSFDEEEQWEKEREQWSKRDLSDKEYVYLWADGIYFNVRLNDDRPCVLVIVGSLPDGTKELVTTSDGERESKLSWKNVLRDLEKRGLKIPSKLNIADGDLGFWSALEEEYPTSKQQRCWVHKTANILDKLPKKVQPLAKERIHEIYMAETKKAALEAYDEFLKLYEAKYPKACACLKKDKETLLTFYDFPAEHWRHIRTTNPIESTFATYAIELDKPKDVDRGKQPFQWSTSSGWKPRKAGVDSTGIVNPIVS